MAADLGLQDEVERILRKLSLEDIKAVATHLEIQNLDAVDNARTVLRSVQDQFDNAANADARNLLLRGLPIPEGHAASYERLWGPDQVVPTVEQNDLGDNVGGGGNAAGQVGGPPVGENQQNGPQPLGIPNGLQNTRPNPSVNVLQNSSQQYGLQQNFGGFQHYGLPPQHPWLGGRYPGNSAPNLVGINPINNVNPGPMQPFRLQNYPNYAGQMQQQHNVSGGVLNTSNQVLQQNAVGPSHDFGGVPPGVTHGSVNNSGNVSTQNAQLHPAIVFPQQNQAQQRIVQMFPREFRMTGNISDDIEKSNEYLDICRQVADGRRKGYSDVEIMSGLRRIIAPGAVKTYVDSQMDLPLEDVLLFLRSFLKVRSPAELNNELSQLAQAEGQAAIKFFMDAIKLRQLLIVGSQLEGNVSYDPKLVQSTFLHTIRTGLRDESVRTYMLPFLAEMSQIDDNRLIQELHKAVAEAEERKTKTKKGEKTAKVSVVESSPELSAVMKKLEENENQMKAMQEQMKELLAGNAKKIPNWKKNAGCQPCKDKNIASSCRHCWKCGQDGHKSQDCPN